MTSTLATSAKKMALRFFIVSSTLAILAGCNYRVFDLAEYPELQGSLGGLDFKAMPTEENFESIYKTVITQSSCLNCHKPGEKAEDVPLDTYEDLVRADAGDPLIVPGKPEESPFYTVLLPTAKRFMPPKKSGLPAVPNERVEVIRQWILKGAPEK